MWINKYTYKLLSICFVSKLLMLNIRPEWRVLITDMISKYLYSAGIQTTDIFNNRIRKNIFKFEEKEKKKYGDNRDNVMK